MHYLTKLCILFDIHACTLRRWCRSAGIVPHTDPLDCRRRWFSDKQLIVLARLYRRVLLVQSDTIELLAYEQLRCEVDEIKKKAGFALAEIGLNML